MDDHLDILIEDADKKIAQYEGLSAMFSTFAADTRKYRNALCQDRDMIDDLTKRCERAEARAEQAETALDCERRRPLIRDSEIKELYKGNKIVWQTNGTTDIQPLPHT